MSEKKYSEQISAKQLEDELNRLKKRNIFRRGKKKDLPTRIVPLSAPRLSVPRIEMELKDGKLTPPAEAFKKAKVERKSDVTRENAPETENAAETAASTAETVKAAPIAEDAHEAAENAHGIGEQSSENVAVSGEISLAQTEQENIKTPEQEIQQEQQEHQTQPKQTEPQKTDPEKDEAKPWGQDKSQTHGESPKSTEKSVEREAALQSANGADSSGNFAGQLEEELTRVKHKREYGRMLRETVIILLGVAAIAVLISMLFLPVLRVTGSSMEPTLLSDDIVICRKTDDLDKGDIAAFYFNNKVLLKRVIGVAGDVISISDSGEVTVNGSVVDEPYIDHLSIGECDLDFPFQVPENRIFVLGDNRETSIDSRSNAIGCIADEYIIGKVIFRAWPFGRLGTF